MRADASVPGRIVTSSTRPSWRLLRTTTYGRGNPDPSKKTGKLPPKAEALYQGMLRYFPLDHSKVVEGQKNLSIRPHHFPEALLRWRVKKVEPFKRPLSRKEVREIVFMDNDRHRMMERSNTFTFLCGKRLPEQARNKLYKATYVQSPMETKSAVKIFVADLTSEKRSRVCSAAQKKPKDPRSPKRKKARRKKTGTGTSVAYMAGVDKTPQPTLHLPGMHITPSPVGVDTAQSNALLPLQDTTNLTTPTLCTTPTMLPTNKRKAPPGDVTGAMLSQNHLSLSPPKELKATTFVLVDQDRFDDDSVVHGSLLCSDTELEIEQESDKVSPEVSISPLLPVSVYECQLCLKMQFSNLVASDADVFNVMSASVVAGGTNTWEGLPEEEVKEKRLFLTEKFRSFGVVPIVSHLLVAYFCSSVRFMLDERGLWFSPCNNYSPGSSVCSLFTIRSSGFGSRDLFCSACADQRLVDLRKKRRLTDNPSRCRPLNRHSTPETLHEVCAHLKRKNNNQRRRLKRLMNKLEKQKEALVVPVGSSVHSIMLEAVRYIEKNQASSREELLQALIEIELGGAEGMGNTNTTKQQRDFVDLVMNNIVNMSHKLRGNESQCRYSPHMMNAALALFMRNRSAYDELRNSKVICLPSPRKMREVSSKSKVKEGGDPSLYFHFQEELRDKHADEPMIGHLLLDEIKLKNGVAYNCNSNVVLGFAEDAFNLNDIYEQVLRGETVENDGDEENLKGGELTMYANQWRLRTTRGVARNADFFFNTGSLNGDSMLAQFIQVLKSYEFIGVKILGICCDAGGGNASFLKLLRKHKKVEGPWPEIDRVSFKNPVNPARDIFYWTCSTHCLKAMRNSFYKSQPQLPRNFIRDKIEFGWGDIVGCFLRDEKLRTQGLEPRSDLARHAVYLDHFTIMNCRFAKQPFSERTISAMIRHVAESLCMTVDWKSESTSQWHKFKRMCDEVKMLASSETVDTEIKSAICTVEFLVNVHGIYTERLLNSKFCFTAENIESEKALQYFSDWRGEREEMEQHFHLDGKDSARLYPAPQTYENLMLLVAGFVAYCEAVLELDPDGYIPALHSNQSALEAFFSFIRHMGKDRPESYGVGVAQQNTLNSVKAYNKATAGNAMYPAEDIADERYLGTAKAHNDSLDRAQDILACHIETLGKDEDRRCSIVPEGYHHCGTALGYLLGDHFSSQVLQKSPSFQHFCMSDEKFSDFFLLSVHSDETNRIWFERFVDKTKMNSVNQLCRSMVEAIIGLVEKTLDASKRTHESSFEACALGFYQSGGIQELFAENNLDSDFDQPICNVTLFDFLKEKVFRIWLPEAIRRYREWINARDEERRGIAPQDQNNNEVMEHPTEAPTTTDENVNRFVGWALWSVKKKYKKRIERGLSKDKADRRNKAVVEMLEDMKVEERDIMDNTAYLRFYYPLDDAIRNKGSLTLISPEYIQKYSTLSRYIGEKLTLQEVKLHAKKGTIKADLLSSMAQDGKMEVLDSILDASESRKPDLELTRSDRKDVFLEMMEKMCNAKIGTVIRQYRSDYLYRHNDTTHRQKLAVLSKGSDYNKEKFSKASHAR